MEGAASLEHQRAMEEKTTPVGRGRRIAQPTQRLTYDQLGDPVVKSVSKAPPPPKPRVAKAATIVSSKSSTSTRIEQNKLETEKKISALEEEIEEKTGELEEAQSEVKAISEMLKKVRGNPSPDDSKAEIKKLEFDLINANKVVEKLKSKLDSLKRSFERRKRLILKEGDVNEKIILEDGEEDAKSDENPEDKQQRVNDWVENVQPEPPVDEEQGADAARDVPPPPPEDKEMDSMTKLVTAFTKAMSSQAQTEKIVIKETTDKELPEFRGNPEAWVTFKSAYERTTTRYKYDDQQNLSRLMNALKGQAREAVQDLFNNPGNVKEIMETLEEEFGSPKFIIKALIKKVEESKPPDLRKPETVKEFARKIRSLVSSITTHKMEGYMDNAYLLDRVVSKLSMEQKERWHTWILNDISRKENMKNFHEWMKIQNKLACSMSEVSFKEDEKEGKARRSQGIHTSEKVFEKGKGKCVCCEKSGHKLDNCWKFQKQKLRDKKICLRENNLCYLCFGSGHRYNECPNPVTCNVADCPKPSSHHPLLHFKGEKNEKESSEPTPSTSNTEEKEINTASSRANILPVIPVYLRGPKGKIKVYALLDSGSSFCVLEEELAVRLGLEGKHQTLKYTVYGDKREEKSMEVSLDISGDFDRAPFYNVKRLSTVKKMQLSARSFDAEQLKEKFPYLRNMKMKSFRKARPQLILGANVGGLYAARQILESSPGEIPAAVKSLLGWYVIEDEDSIEKCIQFAVLDDQMHEDIRQFVSLENLGVKEENSSRSKEDKIAMEFFKKETFLEDQRWTTALPWRDPNAELPPSKDMAMKRLYNMEKKMDRDKEFAALCEEKFSAYIKAGYLKEVNATESPINKKKWYLPWFFAKHPNKKPRLVFDAAAKVEGKCLNDFLLTGPDLLQPLYSVLIRFRRHQVAITADIQQMFHQVRLREEDHASQTILYRGVQRERAPVEYQMSVLFFGAVSSPSLACYAKLKNAERFENEFPEAVKSTTRDSYMDDYLTGADTEEDAIKLQQNLQFIHESGGFPLVKWMSSSDNVFEKIPAAIKGEGVLALQKKEESWEKTLGMLWNPQADEFSFNLSFSKIEEKFFSVEVAPTKRIVTSIVMSVFDPLGFLASLKIKGLLIIQKIWRSGIGWDDEIEDNLLEEWNAWISEIKSATEIKIPRKLSTVSLKNIRSIQLHCFCDPSEEAYACAVYLRFDTGESVETPFIMGKVRVAPMKGLTVPRMELNAALIGTRVAKAVKDSFGDDLQIEKEVYWSDSQTVLKWIRATNKRFKMYVANRVAEITSTTAPENWRWVPTAENVADDATRLQQESTTSSSRWLRGPDFLRNAEEEWPKETITYNQDESADMELKSIQTQEKIMEKVFEMPNKERFSSWFRLIRATAAVIVAARRFLSFRKIKLNYQEPFHITVSDQKKAEKMWIMKHQAEYFSVELDNLKKGEFVNKGSQIRKLSPRLNEDGIIVVGGRLENSSLNDSTKFPPILDPQDYYVKLMVKWFHKISQHFGQERVVNELRKHAWIIGVRSVVKRVKAECLICKLSSAKPQSPEMGQLPLGRVEGGKHPFFHTGVDYFGPIMVKIGRKVVKRWGVIFTCLAIRAVHLEMAESLETSEFINCLARFINLRGPPGHIWSDNGTNFVGADREIRENLETWNEEAIREGLSVRGIQWHFIPPASPHMGGAWERLIRSTKKILGAMLKERTPGESMLRTFFAEVTGIMNSRPLTSASPDPEDTRCLTPNDLMQIPCVVGPTIAGQFEEEDRIRDSWRKSQRMSQEFWRRWNTEYLAWLAQRKKWNTKTNPLQVGDLVLVTEENSARNDWRKGIVARTFPSKSGQVRFVEVKVARVDPEDNMKKVKISYLKRPVIKLCPLF